MAAMTKAAATPAYPASAAPVITINLLKKPPIGGIPIMDIIHKRKAAKVTGITFASPPIFVMSLVCV